MAICFDEIICQLFTIAVGRLSFQPVHSLTVKDNCVMKVLFENQTLNNIDDSVRTHRCQQQEGRASRLSRYFLNNDKSSPWANSAQVAIHLRILTRVDVRSPFIEIEISKSCSVIRLPATRPLRLKGV